LFIVLNCQTKIQSTMLKQLSARLLQGILFISCLSFFSCKQKPSAEAVKAFESVIPKPVSAATDGGVFLLTKESVLSADGEAKPIAILLAEKLKPATGFDLKVEEGNKDAAIVFSVINDPSLGNEGYTIKATDKQIVISANKPAGLYFGAQTLRQLLPEKIEQNTAQQGPWEIATGTIKDSPSYGWRGSMLDVARHFFGVDDVKKYIDYISYYKMNVLHLHLSDDQGWRIEIKSWPNLAIHGGRTQVGGGKGGYYTQEQYKDIVAYAATRYITVIPEIDLPGHINSALASYGELNGGTIEKRKEF
jgi:hexosaminidase